LTKTSNYTGPCREAFNL